MLEFYKDVLGYKEMPEFLIKYLTCPSLVRLKKIGYFCGMDYASKNIYQFSEYISRFDHSLTVALMTYKLTGNKLYTIAALLHDISTPCFSHVIDYMNHDYEKQESTEVYTKDIILSDNNLMKCLEIDGITPNQISSFKKYTIVDNKRPHLCTDRMDGIILTSIGWLKDITKEDIVEIIDDLVVCENDEGFLEVAFKSTDVKAKVLVLNNKIDFLCHANFDNYMMELLANITKMAIRKEYITYLSLYNLTEEELFSILDKTHDLELEELLKEFRTVRMKDVKRTVLIDVKKRRLEPIVLDKRKEK